LLISKEEKEDVQFNSVTTSLEVEVKLWDALMPVIFLMLSSTIFLLLTYQIAQAFIL